MKIFFTLFIILALSSCSKPKSVFICGDHVCINNEEAEQYFEENLSIEVKILNRKKNKNIDLVQLNLERVDSNREISLKKKDKTDQKVKILDNEEISKIKLKIKKNKKKKEIAKKTLKKNLDLKKDDQNNNLGIKIKKNVDKNIEKVTDICTIVEKCSIEEISKYLLKKGKDKNFPDITIRQ